MRLGVIFDSQAGYQLETPCENPSSPVALLLVIWDSYLTLSWPECTKTQPQIGSPSA
jgi:hypothetical protein